MSQDRHKSLAVRCYSKVKKLLHLDGDAFRAGSSAMASADCTRQHPAFAMQRRALPGVCGLSVRQPPAEKSGLSMFRTMRVAWVAIPLGVAACSEPPWTLEQSPSAITLRWYSDEMDSSVADETAQMHCASASKNAELISYDQDGSAQIGRYRCR
jgi:hypothetical protein